MERRRVRTVLPTPMGSGEVSSSVVDALVPGRPVAGVGDESEDLIWRSGKISTATLFVNTTPPWSEAQDRAYPAASSIRRLAQRCGAGGRTMPSRDRPRRRAALLDEGDGDVIDITAGVQSVVAQAEIDGGVASVFVPGSTAAVTTMEHEPRRRSRPARARSTGWSLPRATTSTTGSTTTRTPTPTSAPRSLAPRRRCRCATAGSTWAPGSRWSWSTSTTGRGNAKVVVQVLA